MKSTNNRYNKKNTDDMAQMVLIVLRDCQG